MPLKNIPASSKRRSVGSQGEDAVAHWLISRGFTVLEKNYRTREGEVDLIASKSDLLVFVEVKTRKSSYFPLSQVIVPQKQKRIIRAAKHYLASHEYGEKACRFDVALVEGAVTQSIEYIPHAFSSEGE